MHGVERTVDVGAITVSPDLQIGFGSEGPGRITLRPDTVEEYRELIAQDVDMGRLAVVDVQDTEELTRRIDPRPASADRDDDRGGDADLISIASAKNTSCDASSASCTLAVTRRHSDRTSAAKRRTICSKSSGRPLRR